ncbi:AAA domain-containing protein [Cellulomonas xylanilytica]|uniref:DNA helicase n=1 Tax=Cellulomonas xylanilytica TaxID=233583 RepID=A0A510V7C1_9CELL|nr:AAA domain-containing protein [Cellulomonas xylanilytica]GEK21841.1 DNA helicase [Cellulomonas xylanilytica]
MRRLISRAVDRGGLPPDDVLGLLLPLFRTVQALHETGRVAPLRGLAALDDDGDDPVTIDESLAGPPVRNRSALAAAEVTGAVEVDHQEATVRIVAGWQRWEHLVGHHDELTDVASLGELFVALVCGLDLAEEDDAAQLQQRRNNLFALAPGLHPVLATVASSMIAPDRRRRAQDLADVIARLESYRDQPEDFDLDRVLGGRGDSRDAVLAHLRDRLFDASRRNPLLHFRPTGRTINLTEASVPLVLDVRHIRASQLFTWGGPASARLVGGKVLDVGSLVRWDDAPYAAAALDALISSARRDRAEYGRDQLRLVAAFLRWHDVKNDPTTPIESPLVLAPVTLTKQRGVRDAYRLELTSTVAEVNPVLRHQLDELFGLRLPETVDLAADGAVEELRATIEQQARATQPAVVVGLVDKPRIELVRHRAQLALQSYRRRRPSSRPTFGRRQYAYSYRRPGWAPLGVQIYADRIQRRPIPLSVELGDAPAPQHMVETFSLQTAADENPYTWDVDLTMVTLANFNYRTLSLVRDYDSLLAQPLPNAAFDELFSTAPRDVAEHGATVPVADRYLVVPADASQVGAVALARSGDNFVIQGPPGTGKSQTITNLVADFVAHGKRVLFVCQKRAALDVVHARLRAQGLGEICTLVHDSQQDKKEFVHGLRDTYERWLADDEPLEAVEARRAALIEATTTALAEVGAYEQALSGVQDVLDRLIALRGFRWGDDLTPAEQALLPEPSDWVPARPLVDALVSALARAGAAPVLARTPVRLLDPAILDESRADAVVAQRAQEAVHAVDAVLAVLVAAGASDDGDGLTVDDADAVGQMHAVLAPLVQRDLGSAVTTRTPAARRLQDATVAWREVEAAADAADRAAAGWREPLSAPDAAAALDIARRREPSALKFLDGGWRRVKRLVATGFDAGDRLVRPTVTQALELLVARYDTAARADALSQKLARDWGHGDLAVLSDRITAIRRYTGALAVWRTRLADTEPDDVLDRLPDLVEAVRTCLAGLVAGADDLPMSVLREELRGLTGPDGQALVRAAAGTLRDLAAAPTVLRALRHLDASPDQLEHAVVAASMREARSQEPALNRLDGDRLADLLDRVAERAPELQRANAQVVTARLRARFTQAVAHSQRSVTGMHAEDRALKAAWMAGRRELEHEFGKVRAYKSIRHLASAEPGVVVAAMRPVWLMSPSSLSDTLPLETSFDVVIFDEASQIPVEEAVPALFRGAQVIVVGDRMQLPPTRYFQVGTPASDEPVTDDDAPVGVVLDSDSFLAVGSVRLPSTMLTWHYRSQYEALIQFSNAAFYEGRLTTIPDRTLTHVRARPLEVTVDDAPTPDDVAAAVDGLLERSISAMRVLDGVYTQRTNPQEAVWIAHLVRELLARETGQTLGIVAFSEAQQSEIERALERLGRDDAEFARRYDAEVAREEDGQVVGLFVKNLENVQGDERDVILMSVCYAAGPDGRMRMNFGPINNAGGEKRLNVIFSRARRHMVLVSSIDHTAITNTYNDGANTLRGFLHYADAVSNGDSAAAAGVLAGLRERSGRVVAEPVAPIVEQIADAVRAAGVEVVAGVGQSAFRADLALRPPGAREHTVGVLVDQPARLVAHSLDERRVTQPTALRSGGWRVVQVLATEWESDPDEVVRRLVAAVGQQS